MARKCRRSGEVGLEPRADEAEVYYPDEIRHLAAEVLRRVGPQALARWQQRDNNERQRARTDQSFCVPREEIAGNGYDLSINRYKAVLHEEVAHDKPTDILKRLAELDSKIASGMAALEGMLK